MKIEDERLVDTWIIEEIPMLAIILSILIFFANPHTLCLITYIVWWLTITGSFESLLLIPLKLFSITCTFDLHKPISDLHKGFPHYNFLLLRLRIRKLRQLKGKAEPTLKTSNYLSKMKMFLTAYNWVCPSFFDELLFNTHDRIDWQSFKVAH